MAIAANSNPHMHQVVLPMPASLDFLVEFLFPGLLIVHALAEKRREYGHMQQ
jgi:hypothetical protein